MRFCVGEPPSARWGHTATLLDSKLYIFGGHDGTSMYVSAP